MQNDIILYHGSRGGLEGEISPSFSRRFRDFGPGFYMGEHKMQAAGLVINDAVPILYTIRIRMSEIPEEKILRLDGWQWLYAVIGNRNRIPEFTRLQTVSKVLKKIERYDLVAGPIADDRMVEAMRQFEDGVLTDKGIYHCLTAVNYGCQYVAKTKYACSKLQIVEEKELYGHEVDTIRDYANRMRDEGKSVVQEAMRIYRRDGLYIDEIIAKEHKKERSAEIDDR